MSTTRVLGILLAVQLVAVLVAWWPRDPSAGRIRPVFDVPREAIEEVEIALRDDGGEGQQPLVLARDGDAWVIRSAAGFPAKSSSVDELLDSLLALRTGAPIATRPASHEALQVSDESHGRRIEVRAGEDRQGWLVGPSTSRSVHLRRPGEDDVYRATGASEWSFRELPASYWEARYVDEDPAGLDALAVHNEGGALRFEKREGVWSLSDLAEGESSDPAAIDDFVRAVVRLRMTEPVGETVEERFGLDGSVRVDWTVRAEDRSVTGGYGVGAEDDGSVFVKAVDHPFVVRVATADVQRLREAVREDFLGEAVPADPAD